MLGIGLYMAQRISALIMAPLVLGHLAVMIYAVQGGLSAAEILGRTQGSLGWALFYGLFVLAAAIHGGIGIRVVAHEWAGLRGAALGAVTWGVALLLTVMGLRAVWAVTLGAQLVGAPVLEGGT